MNTQSKEQAVLLAREIKEALETLQVALNDGAEEREVVEAKNIVANVLRSYKVFQENLPAEERKEAHDIFAKKIETLISQAKRLN